MSASAKVKTDASGRVKGLPVGQSHTIVYAVKANKGWDPPPDAVQPIHKLTYTADPANDEAHHTPGKTYDHSGVVYYVVTRPPQPKFWCSLRVNPLLPTSHHHSNTGRNCGSVDLSPGNGFPQDQFGPAFPFKVTACGTAGGYGGWLNIQVQRPDATFSDTIVLGHFWTLNEEMLAAKTSGAVVAAGTYLGSTAKWIGYSTGPHLHAEQQSKKTCFNIWNGWMACGTCADCKSYKPKAQRCGICVVCKKV